MIDIDNLFRYGFTLRGKFDGATHVELYEMMVLADIKTSRNSNDLRIQTIEYSFNSEFGTKLLCTLVSGTPISDYLIDVKRVIDFFKTYNIRIEYLADHKEFEFDQSPLKNVIENLDIFTF